PVAARLPVPVPPMVIVMVMAVVMPPIKMTIVVAVVTMVPASEVDLEVAVAVVVVVTTTTVPVRIAMPPHILRYLHVDWLGLHVVVRGRRLGFRVVRSFRLIGGAAAEKQAAKRHDDEECEETSFHDVAPWFGEPLVLGPYAKTKRGVAYLPILECKK